MGSGVLFRIRSAGTEQRRRAGFGDVIGCDDALARSPPLAGSDDERAADGLTKGIDCGHGAHCISMTIR